VVTQILMKLEKPREANTRGRTDHFIRLVFQIHSFKFRSAFLPRCHVGTGFPNLTFTFSRKRNTCPPAVTLNSKLWPWPTNDLVSVKLNRRAIYIYVIGHLVRKLSPQHQWWRQDILSETETFAKTRVSRHETSWDILDLTETRQNTRHHSNEWDTRQAARHRRAKTLRIRLRRDCDTVKMSETPKVGLQLSKYSRKTTTTAKTTVYSK